MLGGGALDGMLLLQRGMRLSVQPVSAAHYAAVVAMIGPGGKDAKAGAKAAKAAKAKGPPSAKPAPAVKAARPLARPRKPAAR